MSVAAADDGDETSGTTEGETNDDPNGTSADGNPTYKVGDTTNGAVLEWKKDKGILVVSGWGDLSKITITDANSKVFSAAGAGKVYTKATTGTGEDATTTATAVKQGDKYDASTTYYEATFTYTPVYSGTTAPTGNGTGYSVASKVKATIPEGYKLYNCYFDQAVSNVYTTSAVDLTDGYFTQGVNNLDGKQGDYHYYCLVKGTLPTNKNNTFSIASDLGSADGDYHIILLTDNNFSTYIQNQVVITSSNDNLYVKTGDTYTNKPNGTSWTYEAGQTIYTGEASVAETAIADNVNYFGTTHADYLEAFTGSFVSYLPNFLKTESGITYKNVEFRTRAGENSLAKINNEFTRTLVKISEITTLNLQEVAIDALNPRTKGDNTEDPTFSVNTIGSWDTNYNDALTTLYTPQVVGENSSTLKQGVFFDLVGLKHLYISEGIETLDENCLDETQQNNKFALETVTFPNSLKTIKKDALAGQTGIETFTFPAGLESIEEGAFQSANPRDVFFLGVEAPKVAKNAWGDNSYISNNSLTLEATTTISDGGELGLAVELAKGNATRSSYNTRNGWMTMLHYPTACTKEQAAKYTDITRTYVKIDYGTETDLVKSVTDAQGVTLYAYTPGKETTELKGTTNSTKSVVANKQFFNRYADGTHFGGDYTGGYNDVFVGSQYIWPSMTMAYRATVVAQNNLLWDGKTSIAQGIKNAATQDGKESTYTGTGEEYIGLHQFVFAKADVVNTDTKKWDMSKYTDGLWHTICMPFNMTKADMKVVFGASGKDDDGKLQYNIRLCKFNRVARVEKDGSNHIKLYFNDEQFTDEKNDEDVVLQAHTSYMIKAYKKAAIDENANVTNTMLNYVTVAGNPLPTNVKADDGQQVQTVDETEATDDSYIYYFIGNYLADIKMPQYTYFFTKAQNFRFQTTTEGKWTAYTSIVEAPKGTEDNTLFFGGGNDNNAKLYTGLGELDDETTAIDHVTIEAGGEIVYTNDNVYNLNGQLVSTNGLGGLAKGIYVLNGKKYIVK